MEGRFDLPLGLKNLGFIIHRRQDMQYPIKINRNILPLWLRKYLRSQVDTRTICRLDSNGDSFEDSISSIFIDTAWKYTREGRHLLTDQLIIEFVSKVPAVSILEVGASCGCTSLELLNRLPGSYKQYFVTDRFFTILFQVKNGATYFYHPLKKHCIMRVSDWCVAYEDVQNALVPLGAIANRLLARAPQYNSAHGHCASMLHPHLNRRIESDSRIVVMEYDILSAWPNEPVDIIKVANVLNPCSFVDEEIQMAIRHLRNALKAGGKLIITDNRDVEQVSMFSKSEAEKLILQKRLNGGAEIEKLVTEC